MANFVKTSIALTEKQREYLRVEAERIGIPVADLIRRIIDHHREVK